MRKEQIFGPSQLLIEFCCSIVGTCYFSWKMLIACKVQGLHFSHRHSFTTYFFVAILGIPCTITDAMIPLDRIIGRSKI